VFIDVEEEISVRFFFDVEMEETEETRQKKSGIMRVDGIGVTSGPTPGIKKRAAARSMGGGVSGG
jgi:hypothetical protein